MGDEERKPATITMKEIMHDLQCDRKTVDRLIRQGKLPKPGRLGSSMRWARRVVYNSPLYRDIGLAE